MSRPVTERDFRAPEFRDADPSEYEFRADGKIVRKDRWETGLRHIAGIVCGSRSKFEVDEVVEAVRLLKGEWNKVYEFEDDDFPECERIDVRLPCGSVLIGLIRNTALLTPQFVWEKHGPVMRFDIGDFQAMKVVEWRESVEPESVEVKEA